jgi:deoxyribose-phosphate aldolase
LPAVTAGLAKQAPRRQLKIGLRQPGSKRSATGRTFNHQSMQVTNSSADPPAARLGSAIEATRLGYGLTQADVADLVRSAARLGARGVCVPGAFVRAAAEARAERAMSGVLEIITVVNFPTGDHVRAAVEAAVTDSVASGADHIDLVLPGALIAARDWRGIEEILRRVSALITGATDRKIPLKAILETAAWDVDRTRGAALAAIEAGATWLKTSTGFHPAGGATIETVRLLREIAPDRVGVKASGGIRSRADALAMLDAGADRIGTSSERAILEPGAGGSGEAAGSG